MFYAGDGVSDLSAARETDLLFAKKGRGGFARLITFLRNMPGGEGGGGLDYADVVNIDLVTYCEREGVPFTVFEDWGSILETTRKIQ